MRRKIIMLTVAFGMLVQPLCYAFSAETSRFENIKYMNNLIAQFDKETVRYDKDPYRDELLIDVWIKVAAEPNAGYSLNRYLFRIKEREMMVLTQIDYDADGKMTAKTVNQYNPNMWAGLVPETMAEKWYMDVRSYAQTNDSKMMNEYKKRKKGYRE